MNIKVYINEAENFPIEYLKKRFRNENIPISINSDKANADVIFIRLRDRINSEFLNDFKKLSFVISSTTGLTHINRNELNNRKIDLISLAGETKFLETIRPTSDLALSLILLAQTNILASASSVLKGTFDRSKYFRNTFENSRIGILGLGRLGKLVTEYLLSIGVTVYYYDIEDKYHERHNLIKCNSIQELFKKCQIISLHINVTENNKNLITRELLSINPPYKLINTSRADIFNDHEIDFCLKNNLLIQYLTDVIKEEPLSSPKDIKSSNLWNLQKKYGLETIFITPHIGGACIESLKSCESFLIEKLLLKFKSNNREKLQSFRNTN